MLGIPILWCIVFVTLGIRTHGYEGMALMLLGFAGLVIVPIVVGSGWGIVGAIQKLIVKVRLRGEIEDDE